MSEPFEIAKPQADAAARLKYLEEVQAVHANSLNLLASISDFQTTLNESREPEKILAATRLHIQRLMGFHTTAFYLVKPGEMEFEIQGSDPGSESAMIEAAVRQQIEEGTFAWALRQNRSVVIRKGREKQPLLLHVLATRSQVLGMFVGILKEEEVRRGDLYLSVLSLLLVSSAYALENVGLYQEIQDSHANLEKTVLERTEELSRTNEELIKSKKLESVALLAGGIAHDFNNMLMVILGNLSLIKSSIPEDAGLETRFERIDTAIQRARNLTHQLLTFARGGEPIRTRASLPSLAKSCLELALKGSPISSELDFPEGLLDVEIDEDQIRQAFMNLIINAREAMPHGGGVKIKARNIHVAAGGETPLKAGDYVEVAVSDSGSGIPPQHASKIFDPYFTTKSGHSGLGLAIAYSILKRHGGMIQADLKKTEGSTFHLYIPSLHSARELPRVTAAETTRTPGLRILVVDDEEPIRLVLGEMLRVLGYDFEAVAEGNQALERYECLLKAGHPFAAVIMDLTIQSGMGGREAVERLLQIDPKVKVIVSSGHSNDSTMAHYRELGFCGVIPKPYELNNLARVLESVLA